MRGEPGKRAYGDDTLRREALLLWFLLWPPEAARVGFDLDVLKGIVVIVAGRVGESGKPDFGFPLSQARPA